jgi:hypothetical protein
MIPLVLWQNLHVQDSALAWLRLPLNTHVERLADFRVLSFFPVFLLTDLGAVLDGLACTAVSERDTF